MTTQPVLIEFGEWLPDLPETDNPGALEALNCIPQIKSYRSLNELSSFTNALGDICRGTFWAQDDTGVVNNFAGDADTLYQLASGITWTDVSGPSAPYSAEAWEFTKFGDRVIAANIADPLQFWDLGVSAAFADLPGSPPQAAHIATVRDFVVLGDISALGENYVAWSGYNNSEIWDTSGDITSQTDSQELFGRGGAVQRIVPGEFGLVFQENSIWRMDYIGPPPVFQFDEIERKRGTPAPYSVVWTGGKTYFYGWDGFYVTDGNSDAQPISHNRISNWFRQEADAAGLDSMRGAVDRQNRLIIWAFRSSVSSQINNRLLIYNWGADKWAHAEVETQIIDEYVSPGFTLDQLDGPLPLGIDLDSIPVDSDQFKGGDLNLQAFNNLNEAATFDGMPLAATIDTKELTGDDNERMFVNSIRPLIQGSPSTASMVQVGTRNQLNGNTQFSIARAPNGINNEVNVRVNARYQRYRVLITEGFEHAVGVRVQGKAAGGRR